MKSTAPFSSTTVQPPSAAEAGRRRRARLRPPPPRRSRARLHRRRLDRLPPRAERDVRPPLALPRDAPDGADDAAAGDDEPQVVALRRHELLRHGPAGEEPRFEGKRAELLLERAAARAEGDVVAPAAEARLDDERQAHPRRMRPAGWTKAVRGCGRPAPLRTRAVSSLSCEASSVDGRLRTRTPSSSSRCSSESPLSTPSSASETSSRPSATSPGRSWSNASGGVSRRISAPGIVQAASRRSSRSPAAPRSQRA